MAPLEGVAERCVRVRVPISLLGAGLNAQVPPSDGEFPHCNDHTHLGLVISVLIKRNDLFGAVAEFGLSRFTANEEIPYGIP